MGEALPQETYDLTKELFGFSPVRSPTGIPLFSSILSYYFCSPTL
jgi:hypothetical protein